MKEIENFIEKIKKIKMLETVKNPWIRYLLIGGAITYLAIKTTKHGKMIKEMLKDLDN